MSPAGPLADRCILVAGATGSVGGWIVAGALERGATVVALGRSAARLQVLTSRSSPAARDRLHPLECDLGSRELAAPAAGALASTGLRVNAVVAALGRWWEGGPITELSTGNWTTVVAENLTAHLVAAQTFLPMLDQGADPCYLTLAGVAALKAVPGSGAVSVTGAAQQMLLRVLAAEGVATATRFHELLLTTPVVSPEDDATRSAHPDWMLGPAVAEQVTRILDHGFDRTATLRQEPVGYLPSATAGR